MIIIDRRSMNATSSVAATEVVSDGSSLTRPLSPDALPEPELPHTNHTSKTGLLGTEIDNYQSRVLVQGNLSMSWQANLMLAGAIAFVCFSVALVFAFFGLWLVLPFAGLEVAAVTGCLYWTVRRLSRKEVITVYEQVITLEWGYNKPDTRATLQRAWSRLHYKAPESVFDNGELTLTSSGKKYELGASLGRDEKGELARELRKLM